MSARRIRSGGSKIRGGRPSSRPKGVVRRTARQTSVRRGANSRTAKIRNLKRQQVRKQASKISSRPRPVVRPAAKPLRKMDKLRTKPIARPRPSSKPKRSARPTARPIPSSIARRSTRPTARPRPSSKPRRSARPTARQLKRTGYAAPLAAAAGFLALNRASVHPNLLSDVSSIDYNLGELQKDTSFTDVQADIANLDSNLHHALNLLESARDKGYKYQGDLEDLAYQAMSRWEEVSADVANKIDHNTNLIKNNFGGINTGIKNLNRVISSASGISAVNNLKTEIRQLENDVRTASYSIESIYSDIESQASELNTRLTRIHWTLTQQEEASFELEKDEDLYAAVVARWDQEGKEDPEGILFLSNKRLIFERKEKVATKKVLFFTTASELVQEVMVDETLANVKEVKARNKGVFGGKDFIDVTYKDKTIPYQLVHQDNKVWIQNIKNAKSGKIEEERTSGTGLSFSDLTGKVTQADIMEAQNEVNELQDEMMLKNLQEEISSLEVDVNNLTRELSDLRVRGYVVEKTLEADVQVLLVQWDQIKGRSKATIELQTKMLSEQMKKIQDKMASLAGRSGNLSAARPQFIALKSAIASAEAQAEAAEETVLDQFDEYANEVESLDSHFEWIDWMLDAVETASFQLLATESGLAAVEATWERAGLDPLNGILFLTDQRFLWEDREGDYELKIEVPVSQIEKAVEEVDEETGEETLVVSLPDGAAVSKGYFALSQAVAEEWIQMIGRAKSDGYSEDRTVEIDEADLERIKNAPSQCPNCGGAFTAPILRGQNDITCEFCGVVTRI